VTLASGQQSDFSIADEAYPALHLADAGTILPRPFKFDVAIVGLGYVGLPTALSFSAAGLAVLGIDASDARVSAIREERVDLSHTDRSRLGVALGDDSFTLTRDSGRLAEAATVIVCVPTPIDEYLMPDLTILRAACHTVVEQAVPGQVLMLTSTTYVGSTRDLLVAPLAARGLVAGRHVFVTFSPERIDPGNDRPAHEDVPRVVGGVTPECTARGVKALSGYARSLYPVSSADAAEMTKLLENTFRAVNIAMINEFADAASALDLDVMEVIRAASTKPFGFMAFTPGPGVGGHCIPCDTHYLLWQLRRERLLTPVISRAMDGIAARPRRVVDRASEVLSSAGFALSGARVLILGVAYKPNVEDLRESPALEIAESLLAAGAIVVYHDPLIASMRLPGGHELTSVADPALFDADLVIVHTLHRVMDESWIEGARLVLDTTYSLKNIPQQACL
jgi:UDP-N-acetyl-D-glucosamine dehydrogenase